MKSFLTFTEKMMMSSKVSHCIPIIFTIWCFIEIICPAVNEEFENTIDCLPLFLEGKVCKGFGRGSKDLGCPTANFDENVVKLLPKEILSGVYFGWAQVETGLVEKMVMNIGWNPFYKNENRSVETHILHKYPKDFYGSNLKIVVLSYIRPEKNFPSVDELVKEIKNDIAIAVEKLNETKYQAYKNHSFFSVQHL